MNSKRALSVFLLVRSLDIGGAERQLTELALGLKRNGVKVAVGVFYGGGPLTAVLDQANVPIFDLAKRGRWDLAGFLIRLRRLLVKVRPDILYSFLGGANILAAAARPFVPRLKLAWSIRSSTMDLGQYDWTHRAGFGVERLMSNLPDIIISNSVAGRDFAVNQGFPAGRIAIVPNGIDTNRFRPDDQLRKRQRELWKLGQKELAIGMLARLDPMKDHAGFLQAAADLSARGGGLRFVCVGEGPLRQRLEARARELGIAQRVIFAGACDPVAALNGFDCFCSCSITEGFPNALAEAMSCGKPCVATDVGDSAHIVSTFGSLVPPHDPGALATAIRHELAAATAQKGAAARKHVIDNFSSQIMTERTKELLTSLCWRN